MSSGGSPNGYAFVGVGLDLRKIISSLDDVF